MLRTLFIVLSAVSITPSIQIDQAGDGWHLKADSALRLIKSTDNKKWNLIDSTCDRISFWKSDFSSCDIDESGKSTIYIADRDVKLNSINNLSVVIVHESLHLWIRKKGIVLDPKKEEALCYKYELEFIKTLPNAEPWLYSHSIEQIKQNEK